MLTGAPFEGPVAGVRVGMKGDAYEAFISNEHMDKSKLDLVVAGTKAGIMMVEAGANEATEDEVVKALEWAQEAMQPAIKLQEELIAKVGVTKQEYELTLPDENIQKEIDAWVDGKLGENLHRPYPERNDLVSVLRDQMDEAFC
jgi:polyribonucleotide nucleotidyltransferase